MSGPKTLPHQNMKSTMRIIVGILLATVLYQFAKSYATSECSGLQSAVARDPKTLIQLSIIAGSMAFAGTPAAIVAVFLGIFMGPVIGAPIGSMAITMSAGLWWLIGHFALPHGFKPQKLDQHLESQSWYTNLMRQNAQSGFHWTAHHGFVSNIPFSVLSVIVGAKVRHMSFVSFITGVFIASLAVLIGYCLAGASIGCAVINHAQGYDFSHYQTPMLVSCVILVLLSKTQSIVEERNKKS
jgi:uncharacterized membrane protein YdjX (TVP38/TMEM64 family)